MTETIPVPDRIPYPSPPWQLAGRVWGGLFSANARLPVPSPLRPLLPRSWTVLSLFRYQGMTLRYDELVLGAFVWHAAQPRLWLSHAWVSCPASLWGGREIWRVPKQLATFDWSEGAVRITDAIGHVVTIGLSQRHAWLPWGGLPIPFMAGVPHDWRHAWAIWRGRLGSPALDVRQWSERFPFRIGGRPFCGFGSDRFQMTVRAPRPQH